MVLLDKLRVDGKYRGEPGPVPRVARSGVAVEQLLNLDLVPCCPQGVLGAEPTSRPFAFPARSVTILYEVNGHSSPGAM